MATWEEATDENGRVYYYNTETQETSWEKPVEESAEIVELVELLKDTQWEQYTTEEGETYYYNTETKESIWEIPQEVKLLLEKKNGSLPAAAAPLMVEDVDEIKEDESLIQELEVKYPPPSEISNIKQVNSATQKQIEQSKAAFVEMLEEGEVDSTWSFNKVMEVFIKDPRYWATPDSLMKKELFESYLMSKAEEEYQKSLNAKELFKTNFIKVLQNHDIKYYTRWKTCSNLIVDEPIYSLASERLKIEIFNEYIKTLRAEHDKVESELRKQAMDELADYLKKDLKLSMESNFEDLLKSIKSDQRFKDNKHFARLSKLDILMVYDFVIKEIEFEFNQRYKYQKRQVYTQDKIARDKFRSYLKILDFKVTPKTSWFEFCNKIKDSKEFNEIIGRSGSSPIDFFWDLLDSSLQFLNLQKNLISSKLLDLQIDKNTYEEFINFEKLLLEKNLINDMNQDELQYVHVRILEDTIINSNANNNNQTTRESRSTKVLKTGDIDDNDNEDDTVPASTTSIKMNNHRSTRDLSPDAIRKVDLNSSYKTKRDDVDMMTKPSTPITDKKPMMETTKILDENGGDLDY